jgi:hypothetical protein
MIVRDEEPCEISAAVLILRAVLCCVAGSCSDSFIHFSHVWKPLSVWWRVRHWLTGYKLYIWVAACNICDWGFRTYVWVYDIKKDAPSYASAFHSTSYFYPVVVHMDQGAHRCTHEAMGVQLTINMLIGVWHFSVDKLLRSSGGEILMRRVFDKSSTDTELI